MELQTHLRSNAAAYHERRAAPRLPLTELTLWAAGTPHLGRGDLSTGGCFWKGPPPPDVGSYAGVSFRLPGHPDEIRVVAKVLSRRAVGEAMDALHFQFEEVPAQHRSAIASYVERWFDVADASGLIEL